MELAGKKILFLGDSITEGHGASDVSKCFVSLIGERENAICKNYGIGGTRVAKQTKPSAEPRWDLDFISRVAEMDEEADIVVVFGGTNDFGHGDSELGTMDSRSEYTFYGALHTLYISLIEKYPTADIVILTPLHRLNEDNVRGDGYKTNGLANLKTYVNIIREVAEYYSLPVLDLYANSGLQPKVPVIQEKFMPDGLHPSDAGYDILANKITQFLKSL